MPVSSSLDLRGRHFLTLLDYTPEEIRGLLALARELKAEKKRGERPQRLAGKSIAVVFEKPSTRTRAATVVAAVDEGAHPEYLGREDIRFGIKESVEDVARVLGRFFDGIMYRGFGHATAEELARWAGVPVWNALTDRFHPTQALADFQTVQEEFGPELRGVALTYVGDGRNNVANSLLVASAKLGVDFRIGAPASLQPDPELLARVKPIAAENGAKITVTADAAQAVAGTQAVYTDVWASMGEEDKIPERINLLRSYRVTEELMAKSGRDDTIFLHCLPCFHDDRTEMGRKFPDIREATDGVFEGKQSRVFDQAENRMHTIKAVMVATLG
jgi:ornithine carbamoyltransferase